MHRRCCRQAASSVHYTTSPSASEDGRNYRPKQVELIEIINKPLFLHLVGYLYYWQMGFNSVFKRVNAKYSRSAGLSSWNLYIFTQVFSVKLLKFSLAQKVLIFSHTVLIHMFSLSSLICNFYSRINELISTKYKYLKLQFSYAFNKDQLNYGFPCSSTQQLRAC